MDIPSWLSSPQSASNPESQVIHNNVRVTVLTDRLLRLEYASDQKFEDNPTLTVQHRAFPTVDFVVEKNGDALTVSTTAVRLSIASTTKRLTRKSVTAEFISPPFLGGAENTGEDLPVWKFGQAHSRNLGGTVRTLDGWNGEYVQEIDGLTIEDNVITLGEWKKQRLDPGLLTRGGWVHVDDSTTPALAPHDAAPARTGGRWPQARPKGTQDVYLFGYGSDHRGALLAGAQLFGAQPIPPRYAFGLWYSRYHAYNDDELRDLVAQFDRSDIPLDVLVMDMDWHLPGWTGYSWENRYIAAPDELLSDLHDAGVHVTMNLHPADGVGPHETAYRHVANDLGLDPEEAERIPFNCTDPAFIDAYFKRLHHPLEDQGVDFWWMDWQQGENTDVAGLDPLPWLNQLHWHDQLDRDANKRPLVFSRWGGIGGGRYPIGFSGDTWSTWEMMAFMPKFTATAANVLYGYWSHDMGGHYGDDPATPELYTRWMQFGAYSPILRIHSGNLHEQERRIWEYPDPYRTALTAAVHRRYELVPYLYSEARHLLATGLSTIRPMYHDFDSPEAYRASGQYMFGDNMMVAPVVSPMSDQNAMATTRTWIPEGTWYDTVYGVIHTAHGSDGAWIKQEYLLDEIPVMVRGGAVIPGQRYASRLADNSRPNNLSTQSQPAFSVTAYPGGDGSYQYFEDDGHTQDYLSGQGVVIPLRHRERVRSRVITIEPGQGDFPNWKPEREAELIFAGAAPPKSVSLNGEKIPWVPETGIPMGRPRLTSTPSWRYDADRTQVIITADVDLRERTEVTIHHDTKYSGGDPGLVLGWAGIFKRLNAMSERIRAVSFPEEFHPDERLASRLAQAPSRINRDPSVFYDELRLILQRIDELPWIFRILEKRWYETLVVSFTNPREYSLDMIKQARGIHTQTARMMRYFDMWDPIGGPNLLDDQD